MAQSNAFYPQESVRYTIINITEALNWKVSAMLNNR